MPCQSDYLAPSGRELESIRVFKLIIYLYGEINKEVPTWVYYAVNTHYGNVERLDEGTKLLCECCRSLTKSEVSNFVYNAHKKNARKLADWWERHQEWDERRIIEEKEKEKLTILRHQALSKLTGKEIEALGLLNKK